MFPGKFHLLRAAGLLLIAGTSLFAGNFAAPAEGPVAFRRDQLPLDSDTMAALSRELATLAAGLDAKTAVIRRAAAQMLALATALDPANARARALISEFENENHRADPAPVGESRTRVWELLAWLETPAAGGHGRALAACLTDVILVADPENPRAKTLLGAAERGAWTGWIPELSAYQVVARPAPPEITAAAKPALLLAKARVFTPLWKKAAARPETADPAEPVKWILVPAPLEMHSRMITGDQTETPPFSIVLRTSDTTAGFTRLATSLLTVLEKQHGSLPAGGHVTIGSDEFMASALSNKRQSFSAAAAVLASAAISGREPDATIIGLVDESGAFKLPPRFWEQLLALGTGTGGRLVLPAAAAQYLPAMLAFEKPGFFLGYEVLLASNFQELLALTAKTPAEPLAKASAQFQEIRDKAGSQPPGQYVANPFVRRRLEEIARLAPCHYSAKMLAIQGAGNRPTLIPRPVLTSELRLVIEPAEWLAWRTNSYLEGAELTRLGSTLESCRTRVDRLVRYTEKNDRELLARVQELITAIRTLERAARSRGGYYYTINEVISAQSSVLRAYNTAAETLALAAGDPETVPAR